MMTFKPYELDFLRQAELGRLATIQSNGTPQNSPVGFTYNDELGTIDIAGFQMSKSQKYRNLAHNDKVAFVVDDITSRDPWRVRCLEIRGTAEQAEVPAAHGAAGDQLDTAIIRVTPRRIISFGIDDQESEPHQLSGYPRRVARSTLHGQCRDRTRLVDGQVRQDRRSQAAGPLEHPREQPAHGTGHHHRADHRLAGGACISNVR